LPAIPADEREEAKVRLATKTIGAAWWRAASRITALGHTGRCARGPDIVRARVVRARGLLGCKI